MAKIKKILFPTDLTDASFEAVGYAVLLAKQFKAKLHVIHVVNTKDEAAGFYMPHLSFDKLNKDMAIGAELMLKKFATKSLKSVASKKVSVLKGDPYKQIIKYAKDNGIDTIVMGALSKGRVDKFIFGSTTERVMRRSPCPVLIVPPSA
jgi:nucleotide-binding universal stress UspA family protein